MPTNIYSYIILFVHTSTNLFDLILRKTKKGYVIHFISICIFAPFKLYFKGFFVIFIIFVYLPHTQARFQGFWKTPMSDCYLKTWHVGRKPTFLLTQYLSSILLVLNHISCLKSKDLRTVKQLIQIGVVDISPIQLFLRFDFVITYLTL